MEKLMDKVAIVTGGGSGIGLGIAKLFAEEGGKVVIADYNADSAEAAASAIEESGGQAAAFKVDVSVRTEVDAMVQYTIDTFGQVDILVNNAGVMDQNAPVGEIEDEQFARVMEVNVNGVMYGMRAVVDYWLEKDLPGNIINITSIGGLLAGVAGTSYTASKHAVSAMTKSTAFMYVNKNIRVNGIAPGGVATNISSTMTDLSDFGNSRIGPMASLNPRIGEPREIATIACFLASDDASFITGDIIVADGGFTAGMR